MHVYPLDVGTGSAVLVRTANGHQVLIDAGPDGDKFTQAMGRALPPTARTIDVYRTDRVGTVELIETGGGFNSPP